MSEKFRHLRRRKYRTVSWWTRKQEKLERKEEEAYKALKQNYLKASKEYYKQHLDKINKRLNHLIALIGPAWYQELSNIQRKCMDSLALAVHLDIGQGTPDRTQKLLVELGITLPLKKSCLMTALNKSGEDAMRFLWELYVVIFDQDPRILLKTYELESRLLLSSIFYLGMKKTIDEFERRTLYTPPVTKESTANNGCNKRKNSKQTKKTIPLPKSPYLQPVMYVPTLKTITYGKHRRIKVPPPLPDLKEFKEVIQSSDKLKSLGRKKTKPSIIRSIPECVESVQLFHPDGANESKTSLQVDKTNSNSSHSSKKPSNATTSNENFNNSASVERILKCRSDNDEDCTCVKWFPAIIEYYKRLKQESSAPLLSKSVSDGSKIFPRDSYVMQYITPQKSLSVVTSNNNNLSTTIPNKSSFALEDAVSADPNVSIPQSHSETITHPHTLLKILLKEQAAKGYLLALLPNVHKVPILKEWARKRLKGDYTEKEKKAIILQQKKDWIFLRANLVKIRIPKFAYSLTTLNAMNWDHRISINKLVTSMHKNFYKKLQRKFINATRLWWSSMGIEKFPNKKFRDFFFAYMPSKEGLMLKTGW